jgi:hypothetical protein
MQIQNLYSEKRGKVNSDSFTNDKNNIFQDFKGIFFANFDNLKVNYLMGRTKL